MARIHVAAIDDESAVGERYIAVAGMATMPEVAKVLAREFPDRKISTRTAPDWLVRVMARFVPMLKMIANNLGERGDVDGTKAATAFGIDYISPIDAVLASAHYLADNGK